MNFKRILLLNPLQVTNSRDYRSISSDQATLTYESKPIPSVLIKFLLHRAEPTYTIPLTNLAYWVVEEEQVSTGKDKGVSK